MTSDDHKRLTLRLDRVLTAMASRVKEERPLGFFATIYQVERKDLQAWCDRFNDGSSRVTGARLLEVKRELGILTDVAAARSPANTLPGRALFAPGPIKPGGRQLYEDPAAARGPVKGGPGEDGLAWLKQQRIGSYRVVTTYLVTVTPALAGVWLGFNRGNRRPSRVKVTRFAFTVKAGEWVENGETIKFSRSGRLLDGQSRLQAIVEAGVPAVLEVRFGLPDEAQQSMDSGEARRATHTLEMMGEKNAVVLSPALRFVFRWENGTLGGGAPRGRPSLLENHAIAGQLQRHAGLRASVAWAIEKGPKLRQLMPHSEAAFFHYLFAGAGVDRRDNFFKWVVTPPIASECPPAIAHLRARLQGDPRPSSGARLRLIVKAWNAFAQGEKIRELQLTPRERIQPIFGAKEAA